MRARAPWWLGPLLLLAACTVGTSVPDEPSAQSRPSSSPRPACKVAPAGRAVPSGAVLVRGCVATADGGGVRATVVVGHQAGILESLGTAFDLIATAGTLCLGNPGCLGPGHPTLATSTDARGQFSLLLPAGSDAVQPGTDAVLLALPGKVVVQTTFHVNQSAGQDVALQPVQLWEPRFAFRAGDVQAVPSWVPMPGYESTPVTLVITDRYGRDQTLPVEPGVAVDPHLLPPGRGKVAITMQTRGGTYRTASVPVRVKGTGLARGARCAVITSQGRVRPATEYDGCRLTDGDWSQSGVDPIFVCGDSFATPDCLGRGWAVRLDLGRVRQVADVVVVGVFGSARVEVSPDGRSWQELGVIPSNAASLGSTPATPAVQARYVRITGDDLSRLAEVAVFA
jgi:hypothetical protein